MVMKMRLFSILDCNAMKLVGRYQRFREIYVFLQNISIYVQVHTTLQPKGLSSSSQIIVYVAGNNLRGGDKWQTCESIKLDTTHKVLKCFKF